MCTADQFLLSMLSFALRRLSHRGQIGPVSARLSRAIEEVPPLRGTWPAGLSEMGEKQSLGPGGGRAARPFCLKLQQQISRLGKACKN